MNDKARKVQLQEIAHELVTGMDRKHPKRATVVDTSEMAALHSIIKRRALMRGTSIYAKELIETARAVACERGVLIEVPEKRRKR